MKRSLWLVAGLVVLILGFYVVWPIWSAWKIAIALQNQDPASLGAKIDFDSVRDSIRPVVTTKVSDGFDRYQSQLGPAGAILGQFKKDSVPKIVEASLKTMLTPEMMIRIASEAGPVKDTVERIMREQIGRGLPSSGGASLGGAAGAGSTAVLGGLLGRTLGSANSAPAAAAEQASAPASTAPAPKRSFSVANIKSFGFAGPFSFHVGVAKDPAAPDADITAQMSFTGGDWKLTGLVPRL